MKTKTAEGAHSRLPAQASGRSPDAVPSPPVNGASGCCRNERGLQPRTQALCSGGCCPFSPGLEFSFTGLLSSLFPLSLCLVQWWRVLSFSQGSTLVFDLTIGHSILFSIFMMKEGKISIRIPITVLTGMSCAWLSAAVIRRWSVFA